MFSLFTAIVCSAAIALIFKYTEGQRLNRYVVTTMNYATATLVSLALGGSGQFQNLNAWVLWIGIPAGIFFFLSFVWYQISVNRYGAGLSGMFGKLGILMPMLLSLIIWQEWPSGLQTLGILLALLAIVMVQSGNIQKGERVKAGLLLLFLFGGLAEFSNKLFQQFGGAEAKAGFLMVVFATAGLLSLIMAIRKAEAWSSRDLMAGVAVGIPNLFSSWFLIQALVTVPTAVAFPVYSAGSMALIILLGRLIYKEVLSRRAGLALVFTCLALVLLNL